VSTLTASASSPNKFVKLGYFSGNFVLDFLIKLLSVVAEVIFVALNIIITLRDSLLELVAHFFVHEAFHEEEVILQHSKLATGYV